MLDERVRRNCILNLGLPADLEVGHPDERSPAERWRLSVTSLKKFAIVIAARGQSSSLRPSNLNKPDPRERSALSDLRCGFIKTILALCRTAALGFQPSEFVAPRLFADAPSPNIFA
jgi:hypothetical protein